MIYGKWFLPGADIEQAITIRQAVFCQELGMPGSRAADDYDALSHIAVLYDGQHVPAATGRLYYRDDAFYMDAIAVQEDARGQGFGDLLVRMLLDRALQHYARFICLRTREEGVSFFEKYGFQTDSTEGDLVVMRAAAEALSMGCACGHPAQS